jgi:hypothetical protein
MRTQLNTSNNYDFKNTSNSIKKISKKDAERLYLTQLYQNDDEFNEPFSQSENKIPMLRLKKQRNSSDLSSYEDSRENFSAENSLAYLSNLTDNTIKTTIKPSAIYRYGIEIDIIKYVLITKSKLDEHNEFLIKICIKNETWTIFRRYNKFRELHQKWLNTFPILKRISFPTRKLIFSKTEKFLEERKIQLEHYLRCFLELLINEPKCPINVINSELNKEKLCKFCPFFEANDDDLTISRRESIVKYNAQTNNSFFI